MIERRRPLVAVLGALALAAALAGCVSIPSSGPASQGLAIDGSTGGTSFEVNPEGPAKGDSPSAILRGFVAAFQSSTGGYAVAREYLSTAFSTKWDPTQSVQVRTGDARLEPLDSSDINYSFTTTATIDNTGAYKQTNQASTLPFAFTRQGKEWRISSAPNGIVLSDLTFQRLFAKHSLYFLDPTGQNLVPDLRWFPNGTAPTRIVSALLAGPPAWQQGAVRTEFPDGTQLSDAGSLVTVVSGVAHVDLTAEALTATAHERQLMLLQLSESLRSVATVSSVSISVRGAPLSIDDLGSNGPQVDPKVDGQALVLQKTEFGFYANGKIASIPQLSTKVVALAPTAATLASDNNSIAVLTAGGVSLVRKSTAAPTMLDDRPGLIAPSMDEDGYVWTVPVDQPNAVRAYDSSGTPHLVATSLPSDARIMSLQVSRDGARIAILLATSTGPRLEVAAILRDQKLVPTGIGPLVVDSALASGDATDLTWVDELTVATLVRVGAQSVVTEFVIGGQQSQLGDALAGSQSIVGGNGQQGLRVLGDDSLVYSYQGSSWQSSKVSVGFIATQR
ncbi:MAG: hypothetical protein JWN80_205 [Microbacteriaceae bacterium]|nr:hypothetical protein [Microbacteriaceae bacterium]